MHRHRRQSKCNNYGILWLYVQFKGLIALFDRQKRLILHGFSQNYIRTTSTIKNTAKLDVLRYFNIYKKFKPNIYRMIFKRLSLQNPDKPHASSEIIAASPELFHAIRIGSILLQQLSGYISRSR